MALAPWGALGGGQFKTAEQRKSQEGRKSQPTEAQLRVSEKLDAVAKRLNTQITSVALAYVMHKTTYVFPIVGGRTIEHLKGNIEALKLHLTEADIDEIDSAYPFELGFPINLLGKPSQPSDVALLHMTAHFDYVPLPKVSLQQRARTEKSQKLTL